MEGLAVLRLSARRLLEEELLLNVTAVDGLPLPGSTDKEVDAEAWVSLGLFTQILMLFTTLVIGHVLEKRKILWLGEAGVALLLGMLVGVIVRFTSKTDSYNEVLSFQNDFFFLVLLPPIIFEAGFSLNVEPFLDNIGAICTFAFAGTFISTMSIGFIMWASGAAGMCYTLTFLQATLFGAIISATDPVTVLSVFQRLGANIDLYSVVFGESVLNDAVAIVLYRTVMAFLDPENPAGIGGGIISFLIIFLGSMVCGIITAFFGSFLFRTGYFVSEHSMLESMLVVLFAFTSYMIAESLELSGIVAILFCGMIMAKYSRPNLSPAADQQARGFFKILASMAETFVFVYIGTSLCLEQQAWNNGMTWTFLLIALFALAISRALNVYPLSALVNFLRPSDVTIPMLHQHMLWFSGLRGAIAFALSLSAAEDLGEPGRVFLTTTFFIVLLTVLFNGGLSFWMLDRLQLKGGPQDGAFAMRRHQSRQGLAAAAELVVTTSNFADMSVKDSDSVNPSQHTATTTRRTTRGSDGGNETGEMTLFETGRSDMEPAIDLVQLAGTDRPGSPRVRLTGSVKESFGKVVPQMQKQLEKVRELNGRSLSAGLSDIDKKFISRYLVSEVGSAPGSANGQSLGGSVRGSMQELASLDVSEITVQDADASHMSIESPALQIQGIGEPSTAQPRVQGAEVSPPANPSAAEPHGNPRTPTGLL